MYKCDQYLYNIVIRFHFLSTIYWLLYLQNLFVSCVRNYAFYVLRGSVSFSWSFRSMAPNDSRVHWPRRRVPSVLNGSVNLLEPWLRDVWLPISPKYVPLDSPSSRNSRHIWLQYQFRIYFVNPKKKKEKWRCKRLSQNSPIYLQSLSQHSPIIAACTWWIQTLT